MEQLSLLSPELLARTSQSQGSEQVWLESGADLPESLYDWFVKSIHPGLSGKMCPEFFQLTEDGTSAHSSRRWMTAGIVAHGECLTRSFSEYPKDAVESSLSDILETGDLPQRFFFERESMCGNFAQGRKAGKSVAGCLKGGSGKRGWENGAKCNFIPQIKSHWEGAPHPCLNQSAKGSGGIGMSDQEPFSQRGSGLASALSIRTAQTSANGHGIAEDKAHTLDGAQGQAVVFTQNQPGYVPFIVQQAISCKWAKGSSGPAGDEHHNLIAYAPEIAPAMRVSGPPYERTGNARVEADALIVMATQQAGAEIGTNISPAVTHAAGASGNNQPVLFQKNMLVRRLTPKECERLQGFPDDYTAITYKGKPAPDSARYKALGNSMAVPVMRWIGKRIDAFCNNTGVSNA